MKIGILQCDRVQPQLRDTFGDYPAMFEQMISQVDATHKVVNFRACEGELPDVAEECEAYLLTGSAASVYEDLPWIEGLEEFVRTLHAQQIPTVGVCFGHQLIAQALGGKTRRSDKGWGVGVAQHRVVSEKPWMVPEVEDVLVLVSHQDQVEELPGSAEVLLSSEFCPVAMFSASETMIGCQGHPEFMPEYARALLEIRKGKIPEPTRQTALNSLVNPPKLGPLPVWIDKFFKHARSLATTDSEES